jgi:hypothetical protein
MKLWRKLLSLPKAIDLMKRREEEILNSLLSLSERTKGFI